MNEFWFNVWNLANHEMEVLHNPSGNSVFYRLDGAWKVVNRDTDEVQRFDAATDFAAWLNKWEYKPTGKKV